MRSQIVIKRCESYDPETVYSVLKDAVDALGGIKKFVRSDEKILIKPNLLRGRAPENACTTHPAVFEAMIRILKEAGCAQLIYGDSPGVGQPEKVSEESGLKAVADQYQIPLGEFSRGSTVEYPEGKITKSFELAQSVIEADAMISLCKMKTHGLTRITGAVKNQLGCVYGFNKGTSHARFPDAFQFSKMLVDLNQMLKPRLYVMDGIKAMEGNGPASGTPTAMNCLIVSSDPIAVDTAFAQMVGLDPNFVPTIVAGKEMGLGNSDPDKIEWLGDESADFLNLDFKVERIPAKNEGPTKTMGFLYRLKYFKGLLTRKPVVIPERCVGCGVCVESCPLEKKAIRLKRTQGKKIPIYDYHRCIRCYCCQEMCPKKAIKVKTPLLGKLFIYH